MSSGTGTIYQRQDGYFVARVTVGGRRITKYAKSKREAQQRLAEMLSQHHTGTLAPPSKMTFEAWAGEWLGMLDGERRPTTIRNYQMALAPAVERMGKMRLDKITPVVLTYLFNDLRRAGRGSRSNEQTYVVLGTCLGRAVKLGHLGNNPITRVEKPRHQPGEAAYWTLTDVRRFLELAPDTGHQYASLFVMLVSTGLRIGEALGLRWADIDLDQGTVRIERALVYAGQVASIQPPKTKAGRRTITLPTPAVRVLLVELPKPPEPTRAVFTTGAGTPPTQTNLRRALHRLCVRVGVPAITVHGLRHVHAALLAGHGTDPNTLRQRLGHAKVTTTMGVYTYGIRPDSEAAHTFDRAVDGE